MTKITLNNHSYQSTENETVLDSLLRNGIDARFSCGKGICQTCLMKQTNGSPPAISQKGLSKSLVDKDYFLACICNPEGNMEITNPEESDIFKEAKIVKKELLADDICKISLEIDSQFDYKAGQYINVKIPKRDIIRPYSLASIPLVDTHLELHIKRVSGGVFSNYAFDTLSVNDYLEIQSAQGDCYYNITDKKKDILMIATGTGLAPLYGILKDALILQSHQGEIYLYHGARYSNGLYLKEALKNLETDYPNFHYYPSVSKDEISSKYIQGRASEVALQKHVNLSNFEVFLCGLPDMVNAVKEVIVSNGISEKYIHTDAFDFSNGIKNNKQSEKIEYYAHREEVFKHPAPNLKMWEALGSGDLLIEILTDFYDKVYQDDILSPYFAKVSKERVRQKQYNFMYQLLTGKKVYLGDKPRNAHHWMVISDEIFDHREQLMEESIRKYKLPEVYIKEWLDLDESYRKLMVKSKPWDKIQDGIVIPVEGFEEIILDADGVCDYCHQETHAGEKARYQVHEAKIYCARCMDK